ncbi:hypothetical protein IC232_04270 [Microvirga sp. BT688]|uniref:hypothetical protein n=1 Tax=Microvirga sp. TaxID=1873136 RepID=UPI0016892C89|nr:hypothetical protein [Microvirga sp.]MBD2745909.1 hypothetical protein [Microvirga sp.]
MSVIVSALLPNVFAIEGAPQRELELTREEAIQIVTGIKTVGTADPDFIGLNDCQFGYYAIRSNPKGVAEAVQTLDPELRSKVADHLTFALKHSLAVTVESRDDMAYNGAKPILRVEGERTDDPQVQWTGSHAVEALRNVGIKYNTDSPHPLQASDLVAACEKRLDKVSDMDTARLLEIAEYAIRQAGPDAEVLAA